MKAEHILITLIVVGAALLLYVVAKLPSETHTQVRELETVKFDGDFVHVFRDDNRNTTCYVLKSSISCVKDTSNKYEDLYR